MLTRLKIQALDDYFSNRFKFKPAPTRRQTNICNNGSRGSKVYMYGVDIHVDHSYIYNKILSIKINKLQNTQFAIYVSVHYDAS